jgi:hypothetical protein
MSQLSAALLSETAASVLADCAFLMLDAAAEAGEFEGDAVCTTLSFSGEHSGELSLCAPRSMLVGATADMLGLPPDDASLPEQAEATLNELANVLLGVLLARAFGAQQSPLIGLPRSGSVPRVAAPANAACSAILQDMEGRPFVAAVALATRSAP